MAFHASRFPKHQTTRRTRMPTSPVSAGNRDFEDVPHHFENPFNENDLIGFDEEEHVASLPPVENAYAQPRPSVPPTVPATRVVQDLPARQRKQLDLLLMQRGLVEKRISNLKSFFDLNAKTLSESELHVRCTILDDYFHEFSSFQTQIDAISDDPALTDAYSKTLDVYCSLKGRIDSLAKQRAVHTNADRNDSLYARQPLATAVKLPKIELPTFAGEYTKWHDFVQSFGSLVHRNETLSNIDKFLYLKSCLRGTAAQAIDAFDITENNYASAIETLRNRFHNRRLIFNAHIDSLFSESTVRNNDPEAFGTLINSFNSHRNALLSLGTHEEVLNAFFVNLLSSKMDMETLEKWESSLAPTTLPTFVNFYDFLVRRAQALDKISTYKISANAQNAMQVPVQKNLRKTQVLIANPPSAQCVYCSAVDHYISSCERFKALDALARFNEAKRLKLCINCLRFGHGVKECNSKYKCRTCSENHL